MKVARIPGPPPTCPRCERIADGASIAEGQGNLPLPGDFGICLYCTAMNVYIRTETGGLGLRELTKHDIDMLPEVDRNTLLNAHRRFVDSRLKAIIVELPDTIGGDE